MIKVPKNGIKLCDTTLATCHHGSAVCGPVDVIVVHCVSDSIKFQFPANSEHLNPDPSMDHGHAAHAGTSWYQVLDDHNVSSQVSLNELLCRPPPPPQMSNCVR